MKLGINGMGIMISDMQKMVEFYRGVMGFEVEWDGNGPYAQAIIDGFRLMLYARNELPGYLGADIAFVEGLNGTFEIAVDVPYFVDVDNMFDKVVSLGAKPVLQPRDEPFGVRTSFISDPEGNLIEIASWEKYKK
jgi:lactoylglutathione lyase